MRESDVVVIGSGLAGLTAAITAAGRGKKVSLLTMGAGTLSIGGGSIDVLGYLEGGTAVASPLEGIAALKETHPYAKAGKQAVSEAVDFFLELCKEAGFPYIGGLHENIWLPTAAGTMKPSCLVPRTMDPGPLTQASHVVVAGFAGLKDYNPEVIARGLRQCFKYQKEFAVVTIEQEYKHELVRDVTVLDVARWLATAAGRETVAKALRKVVKPASAVIIPPVMGINHDYHVADCLEQALGCRVVETVVLPAAVTGFRLRSMLVKQAKKLGVMIHEQAAVVRAVTGNGECKAVVTAHIDRERIYHANAFVLATGGLFGGGLESGPDYMREVVFNLPVAAGDHRELWGNCRLFGPVSHPYTQMGIKVNQQFQPVDVNGQVLLKNVYVAGRSLAGYDHCFEKSGNGVALVSGYKAGTLV